MRAGCLHLVPTQPKYIDMNKSTRLLITAAAVAGLYTGALASRSYAQTDKAGTEDKAWACLERMDTNSGGFDVFRLLLYFVGHR